MAFLHEFILMEGQKEKEKARKERERKGRRVKRSSSCIPLHRMVGRSASLGITSRRAAKEDVRGSMHAGSVWIPLTPLSCIPQERPRQRSRERLLDYLRRRRPRRFHSPGFCGCSICLQAQTGRPASSLP